MALVLAIEPDRRQAAHLSAIARHLVDAELVLADTTEGALDAIGNRVPDLVLVPALLSPQDDAALAAALRVIAVAAHVRTLTIPVLANGAKQKPAGGMLAKWRRSRAESPEPEGCAPAVFGEQISAYLKEAAAERAELEGDPFEEEPIPFEAAPAAAVLPEPPAVPAFSPGLESRLAIPAFDPEPEQVAETAIEPGPEDEALIDLSEELEELGEEEADGELFDGEPVGVYTIGADADVPDVDAFDLLPAILEADAPAPAAAIRTAPPIATEPLFLEPPEPPRADVTPRATIYLTPGRLWPTMEGVPAEPPAARREQPDWIELVASLRQDIERRRTEPPPAVPEPPAARPADSRKAEAPVPVKKPTPSPKKSRPTQDEWGFFDPEQCGFSMLLAKLDEITEDLSEV